MRSASGIALHAQEILFECLRSRDDPSSKYYAPAKLSLLAGSFQVPNSDPSRQVRRARDLCNRLNVDFQNANPPPSVNTEALI